MRRLVGSLEAVQLFSENGVFFYRKYGRARFEEFRGQGSRAWTDLQDRIFGGDISGFLRFRCDVFIDKKILRKTTVWTAVDRFQKGY